MAKWTFWFFFVDVIEKSGSLKILVTLQNIKKKKEIFWNRYKQNSFVTRYVPEGKALTISKQSQTIKC